MTATPETYFEQRLQIEIEKIDKQIRDLTKEKDALQRQLMKARRESSALSDVNRKNSVSRIMIENRILDALRGATRPLKSKDLYLEALNVDFTLKETTFRTHLHRMKEKGLIVAAGRRVVWTLPRTTEPER